jgi:hypothetical protein
MAVEFLTDLRRPALIEFLTDLRRLASKIWTNLRRLASCPYLAVQRRSTGKAASRFFYCSRPILIREGPRGDEPHHGCRMLASPFFQIPQATAAHGFGRVRCRGPRFRSEAHEHLCAWRGDLFYSVAFLVHHGEPRNVLFVIRVTIHQQVF